MGGIDDSRSSSRSSNRSSRPPWNRRCSCVQGCRRHSPRHRSRRSSTGSPSRAGSSGRSAPSRAGTRRPHGAARPDRPRRQGGHRWRPTDRRSGASTGPNGATTGRAVARPAALVSFAGAAVLRGVATPSRMAFPDRRPAGNRCGETPPTCQRSERRGENGTFTRSPGAKAIRSRECARASSYWMVGRMSLPGVGGRSVVPIDGFETSPCAPAVGAGGRDHRECRRERQERPPAGPACDPAAGRPAVRRASIRHFLVVPPGLGSTEPRPIERA